LESKGRMRAALDPSHRFRLVPVQVRYAVTLSRLGGDDRFSRECQQVGIIIESPDNAAAQFGALKSHLLLELLDARIGPLELRQAFRGNISRPQRDRGYFERPEMLRIDGGQFVESRLGCIVRRVVNPGIVIKRDIHNKSTPLSD